MSSTLKIVVVAGALFAVVATGAFLGGVVPVDRNVHPPCDELPSVDEAAEGLAGDPAFAEEIEALGDGITVAVGRPCPEDPDRGLILVTYGSRSERDAIREMLGHRDGVGVPLHLERR